MNLDDENLSVLTTVSGEFEASAIVNALEAEGIRAQVVGSFTAGLGVEALGGASVMVLEDDLAKAQAILADLKKNGAGIDWSKVDVDDPNAGDVPADPQ